MKTLITHPLCFLSFFFLLELSVSSEQLFFSVFPLKVWEHLADYSHLRLHVFILKVYQVTSSCYHTMEISVLNDDTAMKFRPSGYD